MPSLFCPLPKEIKGFPTHGQPLHPDELLARFLFDVVSTRYVEPTTTPPKVAENAAFILWENTDGKPPNGRSATEWIQDGYIPLGVGRTGSPFDDHEPANLFTVPYCKQCKEDPRVCASDLVAYHFGILEHPYLERLLKTVHANDCHGAFKRDRFGIDGLIRSQQNIRKLDPETLYKTWWLEFEAEVRERDQLECDARAAFEDTAFRTTFRLYRSNNGNGNGNGAKFVDRSLVILNGQVRGEKVMTDMIVNFCWREGIDLTIRMSPDGNVNIFLNRKTARDLVHKMPSVVALLRFAEASRRFPGVVAPGTFESWAQDGVLDLVPNWYFHQDTGDVFNGNATHPNAQPTALTLKEVVRIVTRLGLPKCTKVRNEWKDVGTMLDNLFPAEPEPVRHSR